MYSVNEIITFRHSYPVAKTMAFESLYHQNLALNYKDKCKILKRQTIKVWMFVNGELAGEVYGMKLIDSDEQIEGTKGFSPFTLYTYSISILKPFQGRKLSKVLKAYYLACARDVTSVVIGHSLEGPSIHLNLSFGAKVLKEFPNWYGSGKVAYLYKIEVK